MIWVSSSGSVYFANSNGKIRKVSVNPAIITAFAGNGQPATNANGASNPRTSVTLFIPFGIVGDTANNLYISDRRYIWQYSDGTGIVSVLVGTPGNTNGFNDGPVASGKIEKPLGLWVTTSGALYFADQQNNRIRMLSSFGGIVSTVAGSFQVGFSGDNGLATSASLNSPNAVCVSTNGKLFIADKGNHRVRVVDTNNIITTFAENGNSFFNNKQRKLKLGCE
jgi:hypothetical protein